ncbi:uncharacterized protein LOC122250115 [Penaeus japonicus]|uniref:uncharacterized protein LOC122250115 n=1 Tax=Penaeus japonicus TaxID=27405 RepID=UPI001C70E70B|nr:uncharacterized protein LOC122250115 [Penaeus japonicus]
MQYAMSYYQPTYGSCFGGGASRGNEDDLQGYVDSILPETFRPSFGEDLDARRSLDLDFGAASLWPDASHDHLNACLHFSEHSATKSNFTTGVSQNSNYSSLFDVLGEDSGGGYNLSDGPLLLDSDQRLRDSQNPSADSWTDSSDTSSCSGRKGYKHRHTRKYLQDKNLQKEQSREYNNEASALYRERRRAASSKKAKQMQQLQQENENLCNRLELLTMQSDWCHDTYEKYNDYFAGPLDDALQNLT